MLYAHNSRTQVHYATPFAGTQPSVCIGGVHGRGFCEVKSAYTANVCYFEEFSSV